MLLVLSPGKTGALLSVSWERAPRLYAARAATDASPMRGQKERSTRRSPRQFWKVEKEEKETEKQETGWLVISYTRETDSRHIPQYSCDKSTT